MKSIDTIQAEIGVWSQANFNNNQSKVDPDLMLGSLCPLMGLAEELGELVDADGKEEIADAIGDLGIYLCDYAQREHFRLSLFMPKVDVETDWHPVPRMQSALGKLFHATLKRHQGIRGMDDLTVYKAARNAAVVQFCIGWTDIAIEVEMDLLEVINKTWEQVASRDWVVNPQGPTEIPEDKYLDKMLGMEASGIKDPIGEMLERKQQEAREGPEVDEDPPLEVTEPVGDQHPVVGHAITRWDCGGCGQRQKEHHPIGQLEFVCPQCQQRMTINPEDLVAIPDGKIVVWVCKCKHQNQEPFKPGHQIFRCEACGNAIHRTNAN